MVFASCRTCLPQHAALGFVPAYAVVAISGRPDPKHSQMKLDTPLESQSPIYAVYSACRSKPDIMAATAHVSQYSKPLGDKEAKSDALTHRAPPLASMPSPAPRSLELLVLLQGLEHPAKQTRISIPTSCGTVLMTWKTAQYHPKPGGGLALSGVDFAWTTGHFTSFLRAAVSLCSRQGLG